MVTVALPKVPLYSPTESLSSRVRNVILKSYQNLPAIPFIWQLWLNLIITITTATMITMMMMMMMKQPQHVLGCLRQSVMCFSSSSWGACAWSHSTRTYVHEENREHCVIAQSNVGADRALPLHRTALYQKSSWGIFWAYFLWREIADLRCRNK